MYALPIESVSPIRSAVPIESALPMMPKTPDTVLITAPHAHCDKSTLIRTCDRLAKNMAQALAKSLETARIPTKSFLAQTLRSECDLNRDRCLLTPYRQVLRKYIVENLNKIAILADIHSFPPDEPDWRGNHLVILDQVSDLVNNLLNPSDRFSWYAISLYRHCVSSGWSVLLVQGAQNSIVAEMQSWEQKIKRIATPSLPTFLLEFNEGLSDRDQSGLTNTISEWIVYYVKNPL